MTAKIPDHDDRKLRLKALRLASDTFIGSFPVEREAILSLADDYYEFLTKGDVDA